MRFPYKFYEPVQWQDYATVLNRVNQFSTVKVIGRDESDTYDVHSVELGNPNKPTILIITCMHPPEWATMQYTLKFMEMLRDNTFPDKAFRAKLLNQFHIVHVPITQPWGYNQMPADPLTNTGRRNVNDIDLNDDFHAVAPQAESINIQNLVQSIKPFSFLDAHMFQTTMMGDTNGNNLVIGNGQYATQMIMDKIAKSWTLYSNEGVAQWNPFWTEKTGLAREWVRDQPNPHTPHTLSYITEQVRPTELYPDVDFTFEQIMEYGIASLYFFFKTSMDYFFKRTQ